MGYIRIKDINEKLYQKLKAEAKRRGMKISDAINEAIAEWIEKRRIKKQSGKDKLREILENPIDWEVETDASRVDEDLYGTI